MASGAHEMVVNTQERAVSPDINRLQKFSNKDRAELFRYLLDVVTDDMDPGAFVVPSLVNGTNQGGEIVGGLMVRPQVGSLNVLIDAGVAFLVAPDSAPDDSNYKFVSDVGVLAPITMTANSSGSIRIDVIECQINSTPLIVTDSRDIFNPATGLFSATTVTKEQQAQLTYRIRQGTPGSGYPGPASGWMPLAIASVPTGTTINDTITFWDVRPLVSDRVHLNAAGTASGSLQAFHPQLLFQDMRALRVGSTSCLVSGYWEAIVNGRRLGGDYRRGTPGTDGATMDIGDTANQDGSAIAEPLTGNVYLYALQPFDLPRWARYTNAPLARVPRTTKGLIVASYQAPIEFGYPPGLITFPASTGLGGAWATATNNGCCIGIVPQNSAHHFEGGFAEGKKYVSATGQSGTSIIATSLVGTTYTFEMVDSTWPANAKAMEFEFFTTVSYPGASYEDFTQVINAYDSDTIAGAALESIQVRGDVQNSFVGAETFTITAKVWINRPVAYPIGALASPRKITWNIPLGAGTLAVAGTATMKPTAFQL